MYDVTSSNVRADVKEGLQKVPCHCTTIPVTLTLIKIMYNSKKEHTLNLQFQHFRRNLDLTVSVILSAQHTGCPKVHILLMQEERFTYLLRCLPSRHRENYPRSHIHHRRLALQSVGYRSVERAVKGLRKTTKPLRTADVPTEIALFERKSRMLPTVVSNLCSINLTQWNQ